MTESISDTTEKIVIDYCPHSGQRLVHNDESRFRVVVCGRRWGKTTMALNEAIKIAMKKPNSRIFFIAPTYRQAEMIAWRMLFEIIPPVLMVGKNEVRLEITLLNGSQISLKGADNEDSLRGVGLDFVVLDEYSSMKPNVWQEIVRPMLSDRQGRALFIGTPKGKNHFWELFVKGERKENGFASFKFKTEESPYIPRSEVTEAQSQLNDRYFRQEYEASFEDYTGLIWPEFDEKIHVIERVEIASWWERFNALDTAVSGTTAILRAAIDDSGLVYIYDEYYEKDKRVSEVCDVAKTWTQSQWLIDPAAKIRNQRDKQGDLYSLYDEYVEHGIVARPAENEVFGGINRVAEYFKTNKIRIFKNCVNLISEIQRYHWAEQRETVAGVSRPQPFKSFDHACDCLRYIVMSRPYSPDKPAENEKGFTVNQYLEQIEFQQNLRNQEIFND